MTLIDAYRSFALRSDRKAIFGPMPGPGGRDCWALSCTFMAQMVDGIRAAACDADLDDAVRNYCRLEAQGDLPPRDAQVLALATLVQELSVYVRFSPSLN